jgi:hypothetical protein
VTVHRHRWSGVDFFVAADRPMMRQACACGATRDVRAFDRTWSPQGDQSESGEPAESPRRAEGSRAQ